METSAYQNFVKIPVLCLENFGGGKPRPVVPVVLQARVLVLRNFDIDSWEGANFANLEMLRLENCFFKGVDHLLASFPVLHSLDIFGHCNVDLSTISSLKSLRLKVVDFQLLSVLPASLSFLSVEGLEQLSHLPNCFATIPKLEFLNCRWLSSLEGLSRLNREVRMYNCGSVLDFEPLQYVHKLYLEDMSLRDTIWFSQVKHLLIVDCNFCFETVVGLENMETLYLSECHLLTELPHYDKVKISVWNCENLISQYGDGVTFLKSPQVVEYKSSHVEFPSNERTGKGFLFKGYQPPV
jgi:hypothetical protein